MYQIIQSNNIEEINQTLAESDNIIWVGEIQAKQMMDYYSNGHICNQWTDYFVVVKYSK